MSNRLPSNQLQSGDVLLYHGSGFVSDMIRLFDGSDYSHAALFTGHQVVEAISPGVVGRSLGESVAGAKYVDVYRFISRDGREKLGEAGLPVQPILDTAESYLNKSERYAYEQIVLLAALAATRRMPVVSDMPFLRWMLRKILDNAAETLNRLIAAGKEPMICSELVYRCFAESGPAYDVVIRGADTLAVRARALPPLGGPAGAGAAAGQGHDAAAIQAELDTFLEKYELAKHRARASGSLKASKKAPKIGASLAASAAMGGLVLAVADFVTPRDLRDSPNLYYAGTLQA